jgi:hypothetical protein
LKIRWLLLTVLFSIAVKIYISFGSGLAWFSIDSINYIYQAKALLNGDYLYYFPNGYPLIISFFLLLSSIIPYHIGLILFNIIISTISVVLVYYTARYFIGDDNKLALAAAAIAAFHPNQLNYVRFILTEVPATFFLILSLFLIIKEKNNLAGLSVGFAAAIRTTLLPVAVFFAIYLLFTKKFKAGMMYLIFSLIPIAGFLFYGFLKTGEFTLFIDVPKIFYISLGLENVPPDFILGINNYFSYMFTHPLNFIYDRLVSLWEMWGFIPDATEGLRANIFFRILLALRFPLILFAAYGFIKTRKTDISIYLILPFVIITLIHAIIITSANEPFIANPRYIFPTEPFLIILAVTGLNALLSKKKVIR